MADVLSRRALNRALLQRQLLLNRVEMPALSVVEHLVGMQAQVPTDPYYGLWTRIHNFQPDDLASEISERRAVRIHVMRCTIHLVSSRDALSLRPALQPVLDRGFHTGSPFGRRIKDVDEDALLAVGRRLSEEQPRSASELAKLLSERWPGYDAQSLAAAVYYLIPMVQVTPRGLWKVGGQAKWTTLETWLGRPLESALPLDELVRRYLAAFGPASVNDMQAWCGLTRLREPFERLRPQLRVFRDENGKELFDLLNAPLPDQETPAPVRFLPEYDNSCLGHADRSRIVSPSLSIGTVFSLFGNFAVVLVDGFVGAAWKIKRNGKVATLVIQPLDFVSKSDLQAVAEEGERLLAFAAPEATHDIEFVDPV